MKSLYYGFLFAVFIYLPVFAQSPDSSTIDVLVFTKTNGYRHEVTPEAVKTFMLLGETNHWNLTFTEDCRLFTHDFLQRFDVIVFLQTINRVLETDQQKMAFQDFIRSKRGFVAVHTGTITEMEWPWFADMIGATFTGHPPVQEAKLIIEDKNHPATSFFPSDTWICTDEWYSFKNNPRSRVHVLVSVDEGSYDVDNNEWFPGTVQRMGDHPLVWYHEYEGSRVFQTALGHTPEMFRDELFRKHMVGAVHWAAGRVE